MSQDFSISFTTSKSAEQVFNAVINPKLWWSGQIDGETNKLGAEFTYKYKDVHESTQVVTEFTPNTKVVWNVTKSHLSFLKQKDEWNGTNIIFEISEHNGVTELKFTHQGLKPQIECYEACSSGWSSLISVNLKNLIETGESSEDPFSK